MINDILSSPSEEAAVALLEPSEAKIVELVEETLCFLSEEESSLPLFCSFRRLHKVISLISKELNVSLNIDLLRESALLLDYPELLSTVLNKSDPSQLHLLFDLEPPSPFLSDKDTLQIRMILVSYIASDSSPEGKIQSLFANLNLVKTVSSFFKIEIKAIFISILTKISEERELSFSLVGTLSSNIFKLNQLFFVFKHYFVNFMDIYVKCLREHVKISIESNKAQASKLLSSLSKQETINHFLKKEGTSTMKIFAEAVNLTRFSLVEIMIYLVEQSYTSEIDYSLEKIAYELKTIEQFESAYLKSLLDRYAFKTFDLNKETELANSFVTALGKTDTPKIQQVLSNLVSQKVGNIRLGVPSVFVELSHTKHHPLLEAYLKGNDRIASFYGSVVCQVHNTVLTATPIAVSVLLYLIGNESKIAEKLNLKEEQFDSIYSQLKQEKLLEQAFLEKFNKVALKITRKTVNKAESKQIIDCLVVKELKRSKEMESSRLISFLEDNLHVLKRKDVEDRLTQLVSRKIIFQSGDIYSYST